MGAGPPSADSIGLLLNRATQSNIFGRGNITGPLRSEAISFLSNPTDIQDLKNDPKLRIGPEFANKRILPDPRDDNIERGSPGILAFNLVENPSEKQIRAVAERNIGRSLGYLSQGLNVTLPQNAQDLVSDLRSRGLFGSPNERAKFLQETFNANLGQGGETTSQRDLRLQRGGTPTTPSPLNTRGPSREGSQDIATTRTLSESINLGRSFDIRRRRGTTTATKTLLGE